MENVRAAAHHHRPPRPVATIVIPTLHTPDERRQFFDAIDDDLRPVGTDPAETSPSG
jgi:hypothetical protein